MKNLRRTLCIWSLMALGGCVLNQPESVQHLVKDFNIGWQGDPKHQSLYINIDHSEYGGVKIVPETVFAVGWNQDYLVVLQHPNLLQKDTVFHIIDIRDYSQRFWGPSKHQYKCNSSEEFLQRKLQLGVPEMPLQVVYRNLQLTVQARNIYYCFLTKYYVNNRL